MKRFIQRMCLLIALISPVIAEDRPSWAIIDAVDRLIAQNALFLSSRDGFVKFPNGNLVHYELPSKNYIKEKQGWQVELLSRRWRKMEQGAWSTWLDARPQYNAWKIGIIHVDVLSTGVRAAWVDNSNFDGAIPPSETEVMRQLDARGQSAATSKVATVVSSTIHPTPTVKISTDSAHGSASIVSQTDASSSGLPVGMSRLAAPPVRTPAAATGTTQSTTPSFSITPIPLSAQSAKQLPAAPSSQAPVKTPTKPGDPMDAAVHRIMASALTIAFFVCVIGIIPSVIRYMYRRNRKSGGRRKGVTSSSRVAPPLSSAMPPPLPPSHGSPESGIIEGRSHLLTAAEQSFFAVLEPIVRPFCMISSKVRLADLFDVRQGRGWQSAFNKISNKHIDFVLTDPATSRILCAIELDDSSHNRPARIERDDFINELFATQGLPLLRVPCAWTYNQPALRAKLLKAGVIVSSAA